MAAREKPEVYIWARQDGETEQAYQAFRTYLQLDGVRSIARAAEKIGRTAQNLETFSRRHAWVARVTAYDQHVATADTDGLVSDIAAARDENLELVRKLRGHLSDRLDDFIEKRQDPSVRWTQALVAMAKLEANAFTVRDDSRTAERIERIETLVERALSLETGAE